MKPADEQPARNTRVIYLIISALVIWGALLAIGALCFGENFTKAIVLFGSVGTFVGIWMLLLATRSRQTKVR